MIGSIDIKVNAARPNLPLAPLFAFQDSPSSLRVMDVPKSIGNWAITSVKVAVEYPDNTTVEKVAVRSGSVWVATLEGSEVAGKVSNGYEVLADGKDEDGNDVTGYVLGKGDVYILENGTELSRLVGKIAVRYMDEIPDVPTKGDLMNSNGELRLFDGEDWLVISTTEPPPVYDSQITIKKNGTPVGTFTVNADQPKAIDIPVPSNTSDIVNDSGFITVAAIPSDISAFNNDVGYITEAAIPSNVTAFNNDAGYITQEAIPSEISAFQNDVGYLTSVSWGEVQDKPDVALMSDIPSNVSELENDVGYITASAIPSQVSAFENDVGYLSTVSWGQVTDKPDVALVSQIPTTTASLVNDSGFITASAIPSNVGAFTNDVGYLTASSIPAIPSKTSDLQNDSGFLTSTSTAFTAKRDKTDLSYEYHYSESEYWNIPRWVVVYDGSTFNLDKYNPETMEWTDGSGVWSVKVDFAGMDATPYFTLFHQTNGVLAVTPTEGAGSTTWNFTLLGEPGTVEMDMDGTLTTVDAVEKVVDERIVPKRDYNDISYYATSETYSAYTHGISTFTIATTWSNIGEQTTNAPTVSANTTTWALDNGLGVLTADGSTFYFQQSGSAVGSSFSMDELKAGAVRRVFDIGGYEGINVTANANFFKTEFALKDALPSKTSDLVNDSGFITASAIPSSYSAIMDSSGCVVNANLSAVYYGEVSKWVLTFYGKTYTLDGPKTRASWSASAPYSQGDTRGTLSWADNYWTLDWYYYDGSDWGYPLQDYTEAPLEATSLQFDEYVPVQSCVWTSGFSELVSGTLATKSDLQDVVSAFPSNVGAFTNDVGYLTASSSSFTNKRDYDDLTYPGTVYPSETHRIREFDLNIEGGHNPSRYTLNKFSTNVPNYGSMWANDEEYWNYAVTTSNGEDFTFNKYGEGGEVATFTMSDVTAGAITFTMTDDEIEYTCHLSASMYETTLALKDYVDA